MNRTAENQMINQNLINHVVFVLDASSSMEYYKHDRKIIDVVEAQVTHLARRAKELQQQTRVSVYTFDDTARCILWDLDVHSEIEWTKQLRTLYKPRGNTALVSATMLALKELEEIPVKYGDHGFLVFVLTDGEENRSSQADRSAMPGKLKNLPDNWTVACLVPDPHRALPEAKQWGFPASNVAVWDATRADGVEEAGATIRQATDSYMIARSQGVRGTKSLFQTNVGAIDTSAVQAALTPLDINSYALAPVLTQTTTSEFVAEYLRTHPGHQVGDVFYQLTGSKATKGKRGIIVQGHKPVAVMERSSSRVYTGPEARKLVGLPDHNVTVDPTDEKGDYLLFVRSDASNRILYPGTKFLMMVR